MAQNLQRIHRLLIADSKHTGRLGRLDMSDREHDSRTDRLGRDIRRLSAALSGSLLVAVLMGEAAWEGSASSVVPTQSETARILTLELESPIMRTHERVVWEPPIME